VRRGFAWSHFIGDEQEAAESCPEAERAARRAQGPASIRQVLKIPESLGVDIGTGRQKRRAREAIACKVADFLSTGDSLDQPSGWFGESRLSFALVPIVRDRSASVAWGRRGTAHRKRGPCHRTYPIYLGPQSRVCSAGGPRSSRPTPPFRRRRRRSGTGGESRRMAPCRPPQPARPRNGLYDGIWRIWAGIRVCSG
jgi:hypothetical protein